MTEAIRIMRRPEVQSRTGLSRSSIYAAVAAGTFPQPVKLGTRAIGWREHEVAAWLRARPARRPRAVM
ncbi:MAG: AlpA family phage regulatory protein [Bauldia sp.]|nr:AlpA family phage regulatory protein [Bauldia sp.]MCW5716733.1 AlpA family phage regulatory protein [Bauldia sp.]